jgi:hypothetical protein
MRALRTSVMSLYEVSEIVPGQSFLARDLIRGGEQVRVTEHTATRQMKTWDRIAARIVPLAGTYQMCGGALVYGLETSEKLVTELARFEERLEREMHGLAEEIGTTIDEERLADILASGDSLEIAAPIFTRIWLADRLIASLTAAAEAGECEGDDIVFCTLTFPLAGAAGAGQICSALDAIDDLRREGDASFYNWTGSDNVPSPSAEGTLRHTMHSAGDRVLGGIEVTEGTVVVTTNSLQRAERARVKLTEVLGAMVGEPTLRTETPEEAMAKREHAPRTEGAAHKLGLAPMRSAGLFIPASTITTARPSIRGYRCWMG